MTLQRRRRRNADIFDTGPFAGYRNLGNGDYEDSSSSSEETIELTTWPGVVAAYDAEQITYNQAYKLRNLVHQITMPQIRWVMKQQ